MKNNDCPECGYPMDREVIKSKRKHTPNTVKWTCFSCKHYEIEPTQKERMQDHLFMMRQMKELKAQYKNEF